MFLSSINFIICLKPSHVAEECKWKISCFLCENRHHAALSSSDKKEENSSLTSC